MPEKWCRECGASSLNEPIGRGGRCERCGIRRILLVNRLNRASTKLPNAELEALVNHLEAKRA